MVPYYSLSLSISFYSLWNSFPRIRKSYCASSLDHIKIIILFIFTRDEILEVQIAGGDGGGMGHGHLVAGLAIKNPSKKPTQKTQKTHLKKTLKIVFFGVFGFFNLIFL
jgi:hypothetical protein